MKGGQPKIVEEIPQPSKTIQEGKKVTAASKESPAVEDPIFESIDKRVKEGSPTKVIKSEGKEVTAFSLKLQGGQPQIAEPAKQRQATAASILTDDSSGSKAMQ